MSGASLQLRALHRTCDGRFKQSDGSVPEFESLRDAVSNALKQEECGEPSDGPLLFRQEKLHDFMELAFVALLDGDSKYRLDFARRYLGTFNGDRLDPEGLGVYFSVYAVGDGDVSEPGRGEGFVLGLEVVES